MMAREPLPDDIEAGVRALLPEIPYRKEFVNKSDVVEDEEVEELGDVLKLHPRTQPWSQHPRLYALLRMSLLDSDEDVTAEPFVRNGELAEGLSDYGIPFTTETLPSVVKERRDLAQRVLQLQSAVKSSSESMWFADRAWSSRHRVAPNPPFVPTAKLAVTQGSFGEVESVQNTKSQRVFARKVMLRSDGGKTSDVEAREDRQWRLEHFRNEVEVLRKIENGAHMVEYWGSYTDPKYFALLFQPVAERTLHDLLVDTKLISDQDADLLRRSFGCLAFGLSWLHSRKIRHKDIKPANILISGGSVLYCDFGSALDGGLKNSLQTEGRAEKRTPRYVSPETNKGKPRNEASDVWSLGCVFLEMLTKLTTTSIDELLESIHEVTDHSVVVRKGICYWMGVDSDLLQAWLTQLAEEVGTQGPAHWASTMVEALALERPSAAELVRSVRGYDTTGDDGPYIGQCCATSSVPDMESYPEPPDSPICPSVMSTPTSTTRYPPTPITNSSSQEPPSPRDTIPMSPTSPPPITLTGSTTDATSVVMVDGESHPGTLVFEAELADNDIWVLEGPEGVQEIESSYSIVHLYEIREPDVLSSTRQLVLLPAGQCSLSEGLAFWLPLADTSIVQTQMHVLLSWPDCNHLVDTFANGRTFHSRVYKRTEPNNTLLMHFASTEKANEFARKLHAPCEERLIARGEPIPLCPDASESSWTFTSNGEAMQHKTTPEVVHVVQFVECPASPQHAKNRGLLVRGSDTSASSTSRVYWLPSTVDLLLEEDSSSSSGQPKPSVTVSGLRVPDYKSNVQKVHHSQKDKTGICQSVELADCRVTWCFNFPDDRHAFLDGLSEWSLRLCMSIRRISRKGLVRDKLHGRADLFLFVNEESASAAIAFRLEDEMSDRRNWITGRLLTSNASESYGDMEASVRLSSYYRKELLHLDSMQAVSETAAVDDQLPEVSEDRMKTVKILFHTTAHKNEFRNQVSQYYNCYGDAKNKIHKSSLTSESYARRATAHSFSIQSTSSSSRRS